MDVRTALDALARGSATELEGRGANQSSRVEHGAVAYTVKVHCSEQSGDEVADRIRAADDLLDGRPWYPPVVSIGHDAEGRLVVVRPYVEGSPVALSSSTRQALALVACDLADVRASPVGSSHLLHDFVSPWLSGGIGSTVCQPCGRPALHALVRRWLPVVLDAAGRFDRDVVSVGHGDLHVRNLVESPRGLVLVDWDEVALTTRPVDVAKAMWLVTRHERGSFDLDPVAVADWLERTGPAVGVTPEQWRDIALLGAVWFLPRARHIELLERRDVTHAQWYVEWVEKFWRSFQSNLDIVERVAAER